MSVPVKPWLVLPSKAAPGSYERLLRLGEHADRDGWPTLAVADSALALGFHDSTVALAALAARTTRSRLAVACMSTLGLRDPLIVAQQWANLDALSNGRVTLIACPGNRTGSRHERELAAFGVGYDEKVARTEEYVRLLRQASSTEALTFRGTYTSVDDVRIVPRFVQRPLPLWMTGNPARTAGRATLDRVLGRVARLGDGWLTYNIRPDELRPRVARLHELRRERGLEPEVPVCVQVRFRLADRQADAEAQAREAWATSSTRGIGPDDLTEVFAVGTPGRALEQLARLADAGATDIALSPLGADVDDQVARATEHLLPRLTGAARPVAAARDGHA